MGANEALQTEMEGVPLTRSSASWSVPRWLRRFMPVIATMALSAALLFAMYFTELDWQWVTFLGGVLFTALLALVGRASKAEWSVARRTAQIGQLRNRLADEISSRKRAQITYQTAEEKLRLMADAMPGMLIYVNAKQRVEFHNRAFRDWIGLRDVQIDSHRMSEVFGQGTYGDLQARVLKALGGERITFERSQTMPDGTPCELHIAYHPHRAKHGAVIGFLGVLTDTKQRAQAAAETSANPAATAEEESKPLTPSIVVAESGGQTLYLNSMTQQLTGWSDPEARLRQALERNEFRLYSQEIVPVSAAPGTSFYEIFLRLQEEEDTLAPPGAFIPVAEHLNMTTDLDHWVIRNVIKWHRDVRKNSVHWHDALYGINLFPATISSRQFGAFLQGELARSEIPPQVLCFEIPEEEAIERPAAVTRLVTELNRFGCRVALGGFGGGKVSFDTLNHLPVHFLKIDGSIMRDLDANPVNLAKITAIGRVSKVIGVRTVAQFVESIELLPKLRELDIDYAQGYGISRPQPIDELLPQRA